MNKVKYGDKTYVKSVGLANSHASNKITTVIIRRLSMQMNH